MNLVVEVQMSTSFSIRTFKRQDMKKSLVKISVFLLAFVGISAVPSGIALVTDPSGKTLHMSTSLLKHSPFTDFVIPGAILLCVIGIGSLFTLTLLVTRKRPAPEIDLGAGTVLMGWIVFEMVFIQMLHVFQFLFLGISLTLLFLGMKNTKAARP
jgi:hypothetical protein